MYEACQYHLSWATCRYLNGQACVKRWNRLLWYTISLQNTNETLESNLRYSTRQAYNKRWYQLASYIVKIPTPVRQHQNPHECERAQEESAKLGTTSRPDNTDNDHNDDEEDHNLQDEPSAPTPIPPPRTPTPPPAPRLPKPQQKPRLDYDRIHAFFPASKHKLLSCLSFALDTNIL